jgi:PAS domain S-box-containing protein
MSLPSEAASNPIPANDPLGSPLARATFEAAKEALLILSSEGLVLAMNASFGDLYGLVPPTLIGKHYSEFARELQVQRMDVAVDSESWVTLRALRGERVEGIVQTVRNLRTGREFIARCGASPFLEGSRLIATVITVEDVTEATLARQRIEAALSASEVGVWWIDLVNERMWGDANFARMYGLTDEEANGGALPRAYELMHPDDRDRATLALREAALSGEPHEIEFRVVGRDGRSRWLLSRGRSERDKNGRPIRRMGSAMDITHQKEAEEALRRGGEAIENLLRNSPLGVYAVDADFRLVLVSQGAQKVFENVRPLLGRDFAEVLRTIWPEPFASEAIGLFRHTLETGEPYHAPSTVERRQDLDETEAYDWKIERIAMPDGRLGVVCNFYDLSERQRYEADLESRVEERTQALTRANRDLDQFAYSVAHDLRAPLRTVVSSSRILIEDMEDRLTVEERDLLRRQAAAGVRLARIVDDLLGFARLANAEMKKSPVNLTTIAQDAAAEVMTRRGSACEVEVQDGMRAEGDPSLLGYALTNLLDNACKFSPSGGKVTVGQVNGVFFVRDQGVGFDMAYADKLFVAFERLVGQNAFEGTGVGLANVKRIVERHGGRVWAESEPGQGATFWFTLA